MCLTDETLYSVYNYMKKTTKTFIFVVVVDFTIENVDSESPRRHGEAGAEAQTGSQGLRHQA